MPPILYVLLSVQKSEDIFFDSLPFADYILQLRLNIFAIVYASNGSRLVKMEHRRQVTHHFFKEYLLQSKCNLINPVTEMRYFKSGYDTNSKLKYIQFLLIYKL